MNNQITAQQDCFEAADNGRSICSRQSSTESIEIDLKSSVKEYIPQAKQLHPKCRPTEMVARILSCEIGITKLPEVLNDSCQQIQNPTINSGTKPKLGNKQKLGLDDFLHSKSFELIYEKSNELNQSQNPKKNTQAITMKLRNINSTDFNWKLYKEIEAYSSEEKYMWKRYGDRIDSNFECGNLSKVYEGREKRSYHLILDQDVNTHGYSNWFFFRVRVEEAGKRCFYILNIAKKTQFYKQGMKISVFSMDRCKEQKIKWFKGGENISFFQTKFLRNSDPSSFFYCLYFQYDFKQGDEVYFSLCQPYTYSRLVNFIKQTQERCRSPQFNDNIKLKVETIGYSLCNNIIPSISISKSMAEQREKKKIIVLGRQHPSETAGSFISEHLMKELLNQSNPSAQFLLESYDWIFIPMVNPDGVIYGNSRCNLAGYDLNRQWGEQLIKQFTPETYKIKSFIESVQKKGPRRNTGKVPSEQKQREWLRKGRENIKFVLDLHGHGKKLNSFLFCCRNEDRLSHRIFPMIMSKLEKRFDLLSCTYGISRDKESTLRAQIYDMGVRNCFTFQNSYYGYYPTNNNAVGSKQETDKEKQKSVLCYQEQDFKQMSQNTLKSLHIYFSNTPSEKEQLLNNLNLDLNLDTITEELNKVIDRLEREEKMMYNEHEIESDSDPEVDILKLDERLNMYKGSKSKKFDEKIREVYKKNKKMRRKAGLSKKGESAKVLECELPQQDDCDLESEDEKKLEGRLVMNSAVKQKMKKEIKKKIIGGRKSSLIMKKEAQMDIKTVKNNFNSSFQVNLSKLPTQKPQPLLSNSSTLAKQSHHFDRSRIYSKIKTEITQNFSFSPSEIEQQHVQKEKREKSYSKLKDESLKTMMKDSLTFLGYSTRNKKCLWIDSYSKRQNSLSKPDGIKANKPVKFKTQNLNSGEALQITSVNQKKTINSTTMTTGNKNGSSFEIEGKISSHKRIAKSRSSFAEQLSQKNYKRFESYMKNKSLKKNLLEPKNSVFYHFPIM